MIRGFVLFLLVLFLIAAALRLDFFFTILYLFFGVYALSQLWMQRIGKRLSVERLFVDHAFFGDEVEVRVRLTNGGWLPVPWLNLHDSLPVQLSTPPFYRRVVALGPHERKDLRYTLHCRQRGYYAVGPMTVQSGDLLGLARPRLRQVGPAGLTVYPRIVPIHKLDLPTRSPHVALPAQARLFEDPARVMGVREYVWGDSPRRIHWTATASAGQLLVKQYQPAIARETLICLDLDQENYGLRQRYQATELAIVVAASLANRIVVEEGLPVGLTTEARDPIGDEQVRFSFPPRSARAHLIGILEVLARVQITSPAPIAELLQRASTRLSWGATVSVITGRESTELFDNLVYLRRSGFTVALILVQPALPSAELKRQTELLGVPIHRVWKESDLEAWR